MKDQMMVHPKGPWTACERGRPSNRLECQLLTGMLLQCHLDFWSLIVRSCVGCVRSKSARCTTVILVANILLWVLRASKKGGLGPQSTTQMVSRLTSWLNSSMVSGPKSNACHNSSCWRDEKPS